ncbi:MAG: hypothetical protein L6Q84_09375 [Polyangiaceae bacterium]|nr:hypothetical protein [Polyangiaceae bacterium]
MLQVCEQQLSSAPPAAPTWESAPSLHKSTLPSAGLPPTVPLSTPAQEPAVSAPAGCRPPLAKPRCNLHQMFRLIAAARGPSPQQARLVRYVWSDSTRSWIAVAKGGHVFTVPDDC